MGKAADKIHSYNGSGFGNYTYSADTMYKLASSLPTQVYKVFDNNSQKEFIRNIGNKDYELKDHLGNVRVVISDAKQVTIIGSNSNFVNNLQFFPEVRNYADCYAFGSSMPSRQFNANSYRYGTVNGQEKDDEIAGSGNITTALFWEYDSRIARRWNVDPKPNTGVSEYACFTNNPIFFVDILGDHVEGDYYGKDGKWLGSDGKKDNKVYFEDEKGDKTFGQGVLPKYNFKEWNYNISDPKLKEYMPTLLKHEGGYVNHKNDKGGATNKGITLAVFKKYAEDLLGVQPTLENLSHLNDQQAGAIYEKGYWDPSKATDIADKQLGWMYFDTYLNGGGKQVLNSTLSNFNVVQAKGIDGLNSLLKTYSAKDIFYLYKCERQCRFEKIVEKDPSQGVFLSGWTNRVNRFQYKTKIIN